MKYKNYVISIGAEKAFDKLYLFFKDFNLIHAL